MSNWAGRAIRKRKWDGRKSLWFTKAVRILDKIKDGYCRSSEKLNLNSLCVN